jgi:Spy/CpxP family protein refolding chaperone
MKTLTLLLLLTTSSFAQHNNHHGAASPYKGMEKQEIKALSDKQMTDLRQGAGMSLALAAELNSYPGPSHALELADKLKLTPEQKQKTTLLFEEMQRNAKATGIMLIDAEKQLDNQFKEKTISQETLKVNAMKIADLQGNLRIIHLQTHITMRELLTPEQIDTYNKLRGYTAN